VLVRVRAASLHPDVWHVVVGKPFVLRLFAGLRRPRNPIPGTDMAGVVESVGENVTRFRPGDAVFGETIAAMQWVNGGTFAEYATARQDQLALKPDNVSFEQAASVPTSGFIVLQNLRDLQEWPPGRRVLINGAGGGTGMLALQMMKERDAHVTAVDAASKLELLRSLGADVVIDYRQRDFTREQARYDLIFDVPGIRPFSDFYDVLEARGRYVPIGHEAYGAAGKPLLGLIPHFLRFMLTSLFVKRLRPPGGGWLKKSEAVEILRGMLADGTLTPAIDSTFTLDQIHAAFQRLVEGELYGKVMLVPAAS